MSNYLILGCGYTGRVLENLLVSLGHRVTGTARNKAGLLHFELEDEDTWTNLPQDIDGTFITLPFKDKNTASRFANLALPNLGKIIFMGTTSAFLISEENQVVDETSEVDPDNERNRAEAELLNAGCICVHSAGIYGTNRSPVDWIQDGRVTPNDRYVNFIQVDDLARVLYHAMLLGEPGERYIACDGNSMRWSEIIHQLIKMYGLKSHPKRPSQRLSKRIDSRYTLESLDVKLEHLDVIQGIQALES